MAGAHRRRTTDHQSGYATAETAVALPSLLLVLVMAVWVLAAVSAQLRCVDSARTAARSAARGDPLSVAAADGRRVAPAGAIVQISSRGTDVRVDVTVSLRPFGRSLQLLPPIRLTATATAAREDVAPGGRP